MATRPGYVGKRALDLLAVVLLLPLAIPLSLTCAVLVYLLDGPPILFQQIRVGRRGQTFRIIKFRTMRPVSGPLVTATGDGRVTSIGRVLRQTKLDEIPQLWNVLRGQMSLVGPRPEVPEYAARYPRWFRMIADLRPGMTDWASIEFRNEEELLGAHSGEADYYAQAVLPRKLALARLYHRRCSLLVDVGICLRTVLRVGCRAPAGHEFPGRRQTSTSPRRRRQSEGGE